jgi:hypothetical protein
MLRGGWTGEEESAEKKGCAVLHPKKERTQEGTNSRRNELKEEQPDVLTGSC